MHPSGLLAVGALVCAGLAAEDAPVAHRVAADSETVSPLRRATQLVSDVDAVLPFYRDQLGLRVVYDLVVTNPAQLRLIGIPADKSRVVALESPRNDIQGGLVGLVQVLEPKPKMDFNRQNRVALLFLTHDAHELYVRLERSGVEMLSDVETYSASLGLTYAFTVVDPAGTRISFAQIVGPVGD